MVAPTHRLRQTPNLATRHPPETRQNDRPRRSKPVLARVRHASNEQHELRTAVAITFGSYWTIEVLLHALRARDRGRGDQYFWRERADAVRYGTGCGDVPSDVQVRCHLGRHGGDLGGFGREAGDEVYAEV